MFKRTVLIDLNALEEVAEEMNYEDTFEAVKEFQVNTEDGVCIQEYHKKRMTEYKKYYSEDALKILIKFFEKHQIEEFVIVAAY